MRHKIRYAGLPDDEGREKALADIRDYMGDEQFATVSKLLRQHSPPTLPVFRLQMSFAGVQGYPVVAYYEHLWGAEAASAAAEAERVMDEET